MYIKVSFTVNYYPHYFIQSRSICKALKECVCTPAYVRAIIDMYLLPVVIYIISLLYAKQRLATYLIINRSSAKHRKTVIT